MPFLGFLVPTLAYAMGYLVIRLLLALGIGFVTYVGFDALMDQVLDYIDAQFNALPVDIVSALSTLNVPQCFTIITAAITTRITLTGLRRLSIKPLLAP